MTPALSRPLQQRDEVCVAAEYHGEIEGIGRRGMARREGEEGVLVGAGTFDLANRCVRDDDGSVGANLLGGVATLDALSRLDGQRVEVVVRPAKESR